jgi:protein-S-isoprenylcysteine O-methyltransferase Ste14
MQPTIVADQPLFELQGKWNVIDLSAWISGLSFAGGIWMAGFEAVDAQAAAGGPEVWVVLAAFAAFFGMALMVQRYLRFPTSANTYGTPQHLTTSGVFNYSRNPIYVAFLLPLASIAVFSAMAAVAAIDIYILTMTLTVIRTEERDLLQTFGKEFEVYAKRVPRWLVWTREPALAAA